MNKDEQRLLESQLVVQLTDLKGTLAKIQAQHDTVEQLLIKVRRENLAIRDVTRKNSVDRVLIENTVVEMLKASSSPVSGTRLYVKALQINPRLRTVTFRSHLHRLKRKGLIHSPHWGAWAVGDGKHLLKYAEPRP